MAVPNGAGSAMAVCANENSRPQAQRQFRLLPVPLRHDAEWNAAVELWATARG